MRRLRTLLSRVRGLFRSRQLDQDVRDEMYAHLEEATEEYIRRGLPPAEARREARLQFGSMVDAEEACRDLRGRWHQDLAKDFGYGWRMLRRNPAFSAIAMLSLAVGIGANSAIFTMVDSVLLRPRAVAVPEQIVELYLGELYVGEREQLYQTTSYPSYADLRDRNEVLSGLAAYSIWQFRLGDPNEVEPVWGEVVSGNYFDVLGVRAHQGRMFLAEEDRETGREPVVVIGHGLWQRRFHSDPGVIGRAVAINGQRLTVIGVAPPQFTGMMGGIASEMWVPMTMLPAIEPRKGQALLTQRDSRWLVMVGRLQPDVTIEQARANFDVLTRQMQALQPEEWRARTESGGIRELFVTVLSERDTRVHPGMRFVVYGAVALLVVVVNLVLLIACINLAGMLLARAVVRRKEIAVRLALGASRFRLIRQLLAESVLLALIAGLAGMVVAVWLLELLLALMPALPEGIRVGLDVQLDWRVVAYTMGFATLTGVVFGLAPALHSSKAEVSSVLKDDASSFAGSQPRSRIRSMLIVAQVMFSLLLLIGAGLMLRSLEKVRPTRLGFASDNVVVASLSLDEARYDRARSHAFYRMLAERVAALPGVRSISLVEGMPGGFLSRMRRTTEIEGYQAAPGERLHLDASFVGPHYFTNMKVPIVEGRDFDERDRDGAPCVAVVNEAFARRYFPGTSSPLGKHLSKFESGVVETKQSCAIVGVVRDDAWQSLQKQVQPFYWLAVHQSYRTGMSLLVSTEGSPGGLIGAVRRTIRELDPNMPVSDVQTLREYFDVSAYPFRLLGLVLAACGAMALLLSVIGIYGLVSYAVAQRTREVGIRMALGALPREILRMVVAQGMSLVAWGLALGLTLSLALTRVLSSLEVESELLFGVAATDPLTFTGVPILLALVALVACSVPALRATRIEPQEALRYE